jgi:hypothetical protein
VSSDQVRKPLYSDAVDQWRNYEPWLGPLKEALREFGAGEAPHVDGAALAAGSARNPLP